MKLPHESALVWEDRPQAFLLIGRVYQLNTWAGISRKHLLKEAFIEVLHFIALYSLQRASRASSRLILTTQFPEKRLRLSEITRLVPGPLVNGRMEGTLLSWSRAVAGRCIPVCSGTACRLPGAEQETGTEGTAVGRRIPGGKWIPWPSDSIHPPHSLPLPNLPLGLFPNTSSQLTLAVGIVQVSPNRAGESVFPMFISLEGSNKAICTGKPKHLRKMAFESGCWDRGFEENEKTVHWIKTDICPDPPLPTGLRCAKDVENITAFRNRVFNLLPKLVFFFASMRW